MKNISSLLSFLAVVPVLAGCTAADDSSATSEDAIRGGGSPAVAVRADLMPLVRIGGCSGIKVGPVHFLTAAHCIARAYGGGGYARTPASGATVSVSSSSYDDLEDRYEFTQGADAVVDHVTVDYRWAYACSIPGTSIDNATGVLGPSCRTTSFTLEATETYGNAPDIALIVVRDLVRAPKSVRHMPAMPVSTRALEPGAKVTLAGFGCSDTPPPGAFFYPELHVGEAKVVAAPSDALTLGPAYLFTDTAQARICPGDSGGPVLVERGGRLMVAGIHAGYSFENGQQIANWHTRVDSGARVLPQRHGVWPALRNRLDDQDVSMLEWLQSEGVETVP